MAIFTTRLKTNASVLPMGENLPTLVWNKCEYFGFVGWNPPIPHFTCTLKFEYILLYVRIVAWLASKRYFHCPIMHIINISSPT